MNKILLITPSEIGFMPYVENYINILDSKNADYSLITWSRFHSQKISANFFIYRDNKKGHRRNFLDYIKYSFFIKKILRKSEFDKIIVFGLPLIFFLQNYIIKNYPGRFILDIRDFHKIKKFLHLDNIVKQSFCTVISSPGFFEWIKMNEKIVLNHNISLKIDNYIENNPTINNNEKILISYIGAIRDYNINLKLISSLHNQKRIHLAYYGDGIATENLSKYVKANSIENVIFYGRYEKVEELNLYKGASIVNCLLSNNDTNSRTLLPNRLYNALQQNIPILSFQKTYISSVVKKYDIGLVITDFNNLKDEVIEYITNFDSIKFALKRNEFLDDANKENRKYLIKLEEFICS